MGLLREIKRFRLPKEEAQLLDVLTDTNNYEYYDNGNDIFIMNKKPRRVLFRVNERKKTISISRNKVYDILGIYPFKATDKLIESFIYNVINDSKYNNYIVIWIY